MDSKSFHFKMLITNPSIQTLNWSRKRCELYQEIKLLILVLAKYEGNESEDEIDMILPCILCFAIEPIHRWGQENQQDTHKR